VIADAEPAAIRVVLAEDHYLVREGIRRLIEGQPELELIAVCNDLGSLLAAIEADPPDVVLTDIRMPPTGTDEGLQAAERMRVVHPEGGVVVLSQYVDPQYALTFLGSRLEGPGYLLKERVSDVDQLLDAIREVARGGSYIDPKVIDALVEARSRSNASRLRLLTSDQATADRVTALPQVADSDRFPYTLLTAAPDGSDNGSVVPFTAAARPLLGPQGQIAVPPWPRWARAIVERTGSHRPAGTRAA